MGGAVPGGMQIPNAHARTLHNYSAGFECETCTDSCVISCSFMREEGEDDGEMCERRRVYYMCKLYVT